MAKVNNCLKSERHSPLINPQPPENQKQKFYTRTDFNSLSTE